MNSLNSKIAFTMGELKAYPLTVTKSLTAGTTPQGDVTAKLIPPGNVIRIDMGTMIKLGSFIVNTPLAFRVRGAKIKQNVAAGTIGYVSLYNGATLVGKASSYAAASSIIDANSFQGNIGTYKTGVGNYFEAGDNDLTLTVPATGAMRGATVWIEIDVGSV